MTLALHARGPQFNPGTKYFLQNILKPRYSFFSSNLDVNYSAARLAQLVERKTLNLVVVGSSPTVGANFTSFALVSPLLSARSTFPEQQQAAWPSGLRRQLKALVRKGVGSNPTAVKFLFFLATIELNPPKP